VTPQLVTQSRCCAARLVELSPLALDLTRTWLQPYDSKYSPETVSTDEGDSPARLTTEKRHLASEAKAHKTVRFSGGPITLVG
jgi:hypothetical protein